MENNMYYASEVRKAEGTFNMLYRYRIILMDDLVLLFRHSSYFSSEELVSQFEVGKIRGITKNLSVNSNQFAIHLKRGKDEILSSPDRYNVIEALKFSYFNDTGKNVPVYKSYNIPMLDAGRGSHALRAASARSARSESSGTF